MVLARVCVCFSSERKPGPPDTAIIVALCLRACMYTCVLLLVFDVPAAAVCVHTYAGMMRKGIQLELADPDHTHLLLVYLMRRRSKEQVKVGKKKEKHKKFVPAFQALTMNVTAIVITIAVIVMITTMIKIVL